MSLQGVDPLVSIDGKVIDPWQVTVPITIRVGRESPNSQPDANTCSFGIYGELPPEVRMNAPVEVTLAWGGGGLWDDTWDDLWSDTAVVGDPEETITRFVGRVTDLNPVSEGGLLLSEVVATGRMGDLGRVRTGTYVFPEETEDDRLYRLALEAAEVGIDVIGTGWEWMMAKREVETASILDVLYDTAMAGGVVWESVEGVTCFDNWYTRQDAEPVAYLSASDIADSVAWSQQIDAFIKRAVIRYGTPAGTNSEQPQVTVGQRGWGRPEAVISTFLRDAADATDFGTLVLSRWGDQHAFEAPVLDVLASTIPADTWDSIMGLSFGNVLVAEGVSATPAGLPVGTSNEWYVEGWSEQFDKHGNGPIEHRVALMVSDRARFRPDLGEDVNISDIAVVPAEAEYGTVRQVTALLTTVTGVSVDAGVTLLLEGTEEVARMGAPGLNGAVAFSLAGDDLQYGSHVLTIAYQGSYPDFRAASAECPPLTVLEPPSEPGAPPTASVSLTVSPATVHEGGVVKATATIGMTQGASRAGKVTFQVSRDQGATWNQPFATIITKAGTEKVSGNWTAGRGDLPCRMRATFNPDYAGVGNAVSSSKTIEVQAKNTRTLSYASNWAATYQGDGDKRTDTDKMYQGYYSGTNGNQRSLCGFPVPAGEWSGWTITKVEVFLKYGFWHNGSGGTARIGSHQHASEPPSNPKINKARTNVKGWKKGQGKWVNITSWGKGLATGSLEGICLGPGGDNSPVFYGWAYGTGGDRPQLRVTGYRWQ